MAAGSTSLRDSVVKGMLWQSSGAVFGQIVSALSMVVVVRLLSPSDYGLMATATGFLSLLTVLSELGIGGVIVQTKELTERLMQQVFGLVLLMGIGGFLACYLAAPGVALFYREPDLVPMLHALSGIVLLIALYIVPHALLVREMNFGVKAKIEMLSQLVLAFGTPMLAWLGMGVWSLVWSYMAKEVVKAVGFNLVHPFWVAPSVDFRGAGRMLKYCTTMTGDRLMTFVYAEADTVIVGRFLGVNVLGIYSMAKTLAALPVDRVMPIVNQVSFTSYARIQDDLERVRRNILRATRAVAFAGFPLYFGMAAVAPIGLPVLLGAKWEPIVVPFQILCLTYPLKALTPVLAPAVFAIGRPGVNLVNMILSSVMMTLAFLGGVPFGVTGVCLAWVVVYPVVFGLTTHRSLRVLGLMRARYQREIQFPILASGAMLGLMWVIGQAVGAVRAPAAMALLIIAGAAFYVTSVLFFKKEQCLEIRNMIWR